MASVCQHQHDEFRAGAYTGHAIGCGAAALPGKTLCGEHGRDCVCCGEEFDAYRLEEETECPDCRAETAALLALPGRCTVCARRNYSATDGLCLCCLEADAPARRERDISETVPAEPTAEALALAASMHGLRTTVACLGGAILGFGGVL